LNILITTCGHKQLESVESSRELGATQKTPKDQKNPIDRGRGRGKSPAVGSKHTLYLTFTGI